MKFLVWAFHEALEAGSSILSRPKLGYCTPSSGPGSKCSCEVCETMNIEKLLFYRSSMKDVSRLTLVNQLARFTFDEIFFSQL